MDAQWVRADAPVERVALDERSWVDVVRGFLAEPDEVYETVSQRTRWRQGKVFRYERWVDEPRLYSTPSLREAPHPAILEAQRTIQHRYKVRFDGFALSWYRTGRDLLAFHRDRDLRWTEETVIGLLILGARRPFLVRPKESRYDHETPRKGATHDLSPAGGDLLVMGGRCQVDWEHGVPAAPTVTTGRISVQWRWTARTGEPEIGPSYRAPRVYGR